MFAEPFAVIEGDRDLDGKDEVAFAVDQELPEWYSVSPFFSSFLSLLSLYQSTGVDATFSTS